MHLRGEDRPRCCALEFSSLTSLSPAPLDARNLHLAAAMMALELYLGKETSMNPLGMVVAL